jgi:hypothetical protein
MSITTPTDCEVRLVIQFLNTKNIPPPKIHRQLVDVYGEGVMNKGDVHKWGKDMCTMKHHQGFERQAS